MEEYNALEILVEELEKLTDKDEIGRKLQDIETELLCNYCISIGDIIINPLLVEAYYKCEEFDDSFTHGSPRQKDRFCKVYIHEVGRGGIDICLSKGNYPLAFLIKNALVYSPKDKGGHDDLFLKQTEIDDLIRDESICGVIKKLDEDNKVYYIPQKEIIVKKKKCMDTLKHNKITFWVRKFDNETKEKNAKNTYLKEKLAAFSLEAMKKYPLTIEGGKGAAVIEYIKKHNSEFKSNEEKIQFAKEYANYCPEAIKNGEV